MSTPTPPGLLPDHWAELQASAIAPDVAAANVASWGPGTARHWEAERAELVRFERLRIQTASTTGRGHSQTQPGHLSEALASLDRRYQHLAAGGWRTLSATLPGLEPFSQWKPAEPRPKGKRDRRGQWRLELDQQGRPVPTKYEAPPACPDGGGALLPNVPERCWRLICERQGLPFPDAETVAAGFWPWALQTPELDVIATEGWKKALAAISAGWAAVALPGVTMGHRGTAETGRRLIAELQALACPGRRWRIAFDAEAKDHTARKVAKAAGALAQTLRAAGGRVVIARLPLLPGTSKTGLDDLLAAAGVEALDQALADPPALPALPTAPIPHRVAPAGRYLAEACPIPPPAEAPLVILRAPMGCGKTEAVAAALAPLAADGVPILMPSHRKALGQAAAERVGVPWRPAPGSPERLQGIAGCWDSWAPDSALRITGDGWSGGVLFADEWAQAVEHLLHSIGTALSDRPGRRAGVMRTAAEQLPRLRQSIAADAQMPLWAVRLLERLTGRQALVIGSEAQPMAGRPFHCPAGFRKAGDAAAAFRCRWWELVHAGQPFLCWSSAQQAGFRNAPQTLAALHRKHRPQDAGLIAVIDSSTPELAAELAADPDGFAKRFPYIYASPSISSGLSFSSWKPAAVVCYSGGRIAPEHVAQAAARVRCPDVPVWLFAPESCPGAGLKVGSGATNPAQLIADLRATTDPVLGELQDGGDAWLEAWGEWGALRNRQHYAYRATVSALLEGEGWALQATGPAYEPAIAAQLAKDLGAIAEDAQQAQDLALLAAEPLDPEEARKLETARRRLDPQEAAALGRHRLLKRWGLLEQPPALLADDGVPTPAGRALLEADRDGLRDRLRLGWLLTDPTAAALVPEHDWLAVEALDPIARRPFAPDRLRVAIAPKVAAFAALGVPALLQRFAAGDVISAADPALLELHTIATTHRRQLKAATGLSPGKLPTGTLRTLLEACGWRLEQAGRLKVRGRARDLNTYRAAPLALPEGVNQAALIDTWRRELQAQNQAGALGHFSPIQEEPIGGKSAPPPPLAPPPRSRPHWLALIKALPDRPAPRSGAPPPVPIAA